MDRHTNSRALPRLTALAALLTIALSVGPVMAQFPTPQSTHAELPRPSTAPTSAIEGTVRKVDPDAETVQISTGWFGMLGTTLEVTPDTEIRVGGRPSDLTNIREGDRVRASYRIRQGQRVAQAINILTESRAATGRQVGPSQ